jgi:hypothetical protein
MSAGPTEVAKAARIVDTDAQGKMVVLHEGNNGEALAVLSRWETAYDKETFL